MQIKNRDRGFEIVLILSLLIGSAIYLFRYYNLLIATGAPIVEDFHTLYQISKDLHHGIWQYYNRPDPNYYPFPYLPFFSYPVYLLSYASFPIAFCLWYGLHLSLFLIGLRIFFKTWKIKLATREKILLFAITLPYLLNCLLTGQLGILSAALILTGFAILKKRPFLSGVVFSLLMFKPQLGLLLPVVFIATSSWKTLASFIFSLTVLCILPTLQCGFYMWHEFFVLIKLHYQALILLPVKLQNQLISVYSGLGIMGTDKNLAMTCQSIMAGFTALIIFLKFRKTNDLTSLTLLFCAMFLVSPYVYIYDAMIVSIAIFILAIRYAHILSVRLIIVAGAFMPVITTQIQAFHLPIGVAIIMLISIQCYLLNRRTS